MWRSFRLAVFTCAALMGSPAAALDRPALAIAGTTSTVVAGSTLPCLEDGQPATCVQTVIAVAAGASCAAPPIAEADVGVELDWILGGLHPGSGYTLYVIASTSTYSLCSDPLNILTESPHPPEPERVLQFYPSAELRFRPDPAAGVESVRVVLHADANPAESDEQIVPVGGDGEVHATVTCRFLGDGSLILTVASPGSGTSVLDSSRVRCEPFDEDIGASSFSSFAAAPATTITGRLTGMERVLESRSTRTTVNTNSSGQETFRTSRTDHTVDSVLYDGQTYCERNERFEPSPSLRETCTSRAPFRDFEIILSEGTANNVTTTQFFSPPGRLTGTSTETLESLTRSSLAFSSRFSGIPEGSRVSQLRVRGNDLRISVVGPPESFVLNGAGGSAAPTWIESTRFNLNCDPEIDASSWTWTFDDPMLDPSGAASFSIDPVPNCLSLLNGTTINQTPTRTVTRTINQTGGSLNFLALAEGDLVADEALVLEPEAPLVAPANRRAPDRPNILGQSNTQLRATLLNAPSGSYSVTVRAENFEAGSAGHDHGDPPTGFWGTLDGNDNEATCTIEVLESVGQSSCEITFQADEIAGRVTFGAEAEVDGEALVAGTTVDVRIPGLVELPASDTFLLRGATANHGSNHFATAPTVSAIQQIAQVFKSGSGARLGIDDMSLAWGGIFDISGQWMVPHNTHRDGRDVDISRFWFNNAGEVQQQVDCLNDLHLRRAVVQVLGRNGLLCESGGRKHIDF